MTGRSTAIQTVADLLLNRCESVAFLTGAGVSVAAGIPDFRSPGGLYDTLRPELLTASPQEQSFMAREPTAVVSWDLFRQNQLPYLVCVPCTPSCAYPSSTDRSVYV